MSYQRNVLPRQQHITNSKPYRTSWQSSVRSGTPLEVQGLTAAGKTPWAKRRVAPSQ